MIARLVFTLLVAASGVNALFCQRSTPCAECTEKNSLCYFNVAQNACLDIIGIALTPKEDVITLSYDCKKPPPPSFPYDDAFARNQVYIHTAASNGETQAEVQKCLDHVGSQFIQQWTLPCDWINQNCSAYIAVNDEAKAIILTFRGSKGSIQFYTEALNLLTYGSRGSAYVDGKVFNYFIQAFEKLWGAGISATLTNLKNDNRQDYELWTFGHSLGGSLASVSAVAAVKGQIFESNKVKSITMGQPRTGDLEFAQSHDAYIPYSYRIVHATDLVTKLPLKVITGQPNAYHHRYEVWYNNNMAEANYAINERGDDWSGANTSPLNLQDSSHLSYFNEDIDNYYLTKC